MVAATPSPKVYPDLQRPLVLYKGSCPFCRATARTIARLDKRERLAMLPFDDADAAPYLSPFSEEERDESWHLFLPDGRHMIKGEATIEVLSYLPAASWLSKLFRLLRITPLMGAF